MNGECTVRSTVTTSQRPVELEESRGGGVYTLNTGVSRAVRIVLLRHAHLNVFTVAARWSTRSRTRSKSGNLSTGSKRGNKRCIICGRAFLSFHPCLLWGIVEIEL